MKKPLAAAAVLFLSGCGGSGENQAPPPALSVSPTAVNGEPFEYADGPQLPDGAEVKTPWHLTNVWVDFETTPDDFETFCATFRIDGEIADGINFYFSPFNTEINEIQLYAGLQTRIDGRRSDGNFERRDKGAIFSRWRERDTDAIEAADGGLYESSGHEGDFIGVRNDFAWNEGRYRLCMRKSDEVAGEPLPDNYDADDVAFAWGRYVHTWVRFEATDLDSGDAEFIGALAFPGTTLKLQLNNGLFAEIYGVPDPFPAKDVPVITFAVENFQVDDRDLPYRLVGARSNPIPKTGLEPKLTRIRFDADERVIRIHLGEFTGRFGQIETALFPARPAIESVGLVSLDGDKYITALWDKRDVAVSQLPSGRYNIRADPVDANEVASVRLELNGPVSLSRLANDRPYLLSSRTDGLSLTAGRYRITATPFARADGLGAHGIVLDAEFTVSAASRMVRVHDARLLNHIESALGTPLSGFGLARELERLESLEISDSGIIDLDGLQYATNLRVLKLPGNRIADLAALSGLTQLIALDLSDNRIENVSALGGLANLKWLDIAGNRIADIGPLAGLATIEELRLGRNRASRLEPLTGLVTLRRLDLARNGIRDLAPLASLVDLEVLDISGNRVSDLAPLSALVALRQMKANANAIANLAPLAGLIDLWRLEISSNRITHWDRSPGWRA
ncbi:MAG: leucine-rich repeat domain-containing protein [Gammaproteobacteria bacterium]|nr:leucine-rich repeat domain-containing protein [Gammaproteobacteria bacterium]